MLSILARFIFITNSGLCARQSESLLMDERPNPANHDQILIPIIPAITAPLIGRKLLELLFPIPKDMWLDAT